MKKISFILIAAFLLAGCFPKAQAAPQPAPTETPIPPTPTPGIGDTLVRDIDGATMLYVPATTFEMGIPDGEKGNPAHLVSLDGYWIDKTEVTNRTFAQFLNSYQGLSPISALQWFDAFSEKSRLAFIDGQWIVTESYENHPVTTVNWLGAQAYCQWAGARLPSEAEWELAARGGEGLINPTGMSITCDQANICTGEPYPVGSFPPDTSPYGMLDMGGNVMEWVADWYFPYYFENEITTNPKGPLQGVNKILRGGFFLTAFPSYDRMEISPSYSEPGTGLRCAKTSLAEYIQLSPRLYPFEACLGTDGIPGAVPGTDCVVGVSQFDDGQVQVSFLWDGSPDDCEINSDTWIANLYIVDDLGNRIDAIDFKNFAGSECVKNSVGHLIYPKLDDRARWIVFYDDNQGKSTIPIPLQWVNPVVAEVQPTFAPTPRPLVERFQQVNTYTMGQGVANLSWSADSRSLLVKKAGGELAIIDPETGFFWPALDAGGMQVHAIDGAWSLDGSRLAVCDSENIYMFDGLASTFYYSLMAPGVIRQLAWSPDGKTLATVLDDGTVRLFNASAAQMTRTIDQFSGASYVAWSPDGAVLAVHAADGFHLWGAANLQPLAHWDFLISPSWSPDGSLVAGYFQQQVILQNVATGERMFAPSPEFSSSADTQLVDWSPGGEYFISGNQSTMTLWSAVDRLRQIGSLYGHSGQVTSLSFSPDGNYMASGSDDGLVIVWRIAPD